MKSPSDAPISPFGQKNARLDYPSSFTDEKSGERIICLEDEGRATPAMAWPRTSIAPHIYDHGRRKVDLAAIPDAATHERISACKVPTIGRKGQKKPPG